MALVIGNGAYQNTAKLPNPARDANAVAQMFKNAGFEVVEAKTDLGIQDFKRVIRDFTQQTKNADIAVVFYAGHGIEIGGQNYLIPVDAKLRSDYDAEDEALTLDRVVRSVESARRFRLVILDACRDNPFLKGMTRTASTRSITNGLGKVEPTIGDTLIAYAAKGGSVAEDGEGQHSPFTTALLKHLAEPGLDVRLAFGKVRDDVMRSTGNKQEPFVYGSLGGNNISIVPAKKVAPVADSKGDYELAERVGTTEAWDLFLKHNPTGFYAEMAKAQRGKLTVAAVAPVNPPSAAEGRPSSDEVRAWDRVKDSGDRKALRDFIERFSNSALAVLAQRRLDVLETAEREREAARKQDEESKRARAAAEEQKRLDREARQREDEAKKARAAAEAKQRQDDARSAKAKAEEQKQLEREARQREDEAKKARAAADAKQREEDKRIAKAADDEKKRLEQEAKQASEPSQDEPKKDTAESDDAKAKKAAAREKADRQRAAARRADEEDAREDRRRAAKQREKSRASASREAPARASRPAPARAPVQMGRGGGGSSTMTGVGF